MPTRIRKIKNRNREESLSDILNDSTKRARFLFLFGGLALIGLGMYFSFQKPAVSSVNETETIAQGDSFSTEPVKVDSGLLKAQTTQDKKKLPPDRITIPSLGIDLAVKQSQIKNGYWEVFTDTAGWGVGSAFPQDKGNQVIFAHAREGLFLPLKKAQAGQLIYVFTKDKWYSYKIDSIKEVLPTQVEVIAPTDNAILTLYTCSGFADSKRLIVQAKRIES